MFTGENKYPVKVWNSENVPQSSNDIPHIERASRGYSFNDECNSPDHLRSLNLMTAIVTKDSILILRLLMLFDVAQCHHRLLDSASDSRGDLKSKQPNSSVYRSRE